MELNVNNCFRHQTLIAHGIKIYTKRRLYLKKTSILIYAFIIRFKNSFFGNDITII